MLKLGLIINPIAGIGGKVGLKGSDGSDILKKALMLGAKQESGIKASVAIKRIYELAPSIHIYTCPKDMGEDIAKSTGFQTTIIEGISMDSTSSEDTIRAAKKLKDLKVHLILFAGGDGTARNIMDAIGSSVPVLGIPTGCKIHSASYALNPKTAGELVVDFLNGKIKETREAEVMDIDEDLFRQNIVDAKLYGYLKVPNERKRVQNLKSGRGQREENTISMLSNYISKNLLPDTLYIVAPGSTTKKIMDTIGVESTLLGVDLFINREIVKLDATENDILLWLKKYPKAKIIVTVIGGQGYVFGRGNQQISAQVLEKVGKENIIIAASKDKLLSLFGQKLHLDTGNEKMNKALSGYYKIIVGYEDYVMFQVTD